VFFAALSWCSRVRGGVCSSTRGRSPGSSCGREPRFCSSGNPGSARPFSGGGAVSVPVVGVSPPAGVLTIVRGEGGRIVPGAVAVRSIPGIAAPRAVMVRSIPRVAASRAVASTVIVTRSAAADKEGSAAGPADIDSKARCGNEEVASPPTVTRLSRQRRQEDGKESKDRDDKRRIPFHGLHTSSSNLDASRGG